jgi:formylglycine-generating enzyme
MISVERLRLAEVEKRVCDIAAEQLGISRERATPSARLIEDCGADSLDVVEFAMEIEQVFGVTLPEDAPNPVYKAVFTRQPFRLGDIAELVYLQQGTGTPERKGWFGTRTEPPPVASLPFTQLDGRWEPREDKQRLFEPLTTKRPVREYRRRSDGMRCILIPAARVEIGCDSSESLLDERPMHVVEMESFLIDAEPVSTTAYCRFLNSIGPTTPECLADLFVLDPLDDRNQHVLVRRSESEWRPLPETERWPMILVSWYGANAYSLWANGRDWTNYRDESGVECELPTEAQWEYAARGSRQQPFPWGNAPPSQERMRYGQHRRRATYLAETMPMADVNAPLGMSPFGLHHMAGNVWQWCRDWYDAAFYSRPEASWRNPVNRKPSGVRSERGGSWVGPAELCRSSFRRGRPPLARGRCLGFRCVSCLEDAP